MFFCRPCSSQRRHDEVQTHRWTVDVLGHCRGEGRHRGRAAVSAGANALQGAEGYKLPKNTRPTLFLSACNIKDHNFVDSMEHIKGKHAGTVKAATFNEHSSRIAN